MKKTKDNNKDNKQITDQESEETKKPLIDRLNMREDKKIILKYLIMALIYSWGILFGPFLLLSLVLGRLESFIDILTPLNLVLFNILIPIGVFLVYLIFNSELRNAVKEFFRNL